MKLKDSVKASGVQPEALLAMVVAAELMRRLGYELTITSLLDGVHKSGSKHYDGKAFDMRTFDLPEGMAATVRNKLEQALGPEFDVVLEHDHVHVEFEGPRGVAPAGPRV